MRAFLANAAAASSLLLATGCSIKHRALVSVADAWSSTGEGGAFASDDDPELVRDSLPFALKTMESLALQLDDHVALRAAMARGFATYGYAFVQMPADLMSDKEPAQAKELRGRATRLFLRARGYGLDGLRMAHGITVEQLRAASRDAALLHIEKQDVDLVYWTLVPWAAAVALNKTNMNLVGDLGAIAALLDKAFALDEAYGKGALHEFSLAFDPARPGGTTRAKQAAHFARAVELTGGKRLSVFVTWAENVLAQNQEKEVFQKELQRVLAFDVDDPAARNERLSNILSQRRARYLLSRVSDLFLD